MNIFTRILRPSTRRKLAGAFGLLLILGMLVFATVPVLAVQSIPDTFGGHVTINGTQAPQGTTVAAKIGGVVYGANASTTVDASGNYLLFVLSDDPATPAKEGGVNTDTIDFYVNNVLARSAPFVAEALNMNFDLAVTITPGPFTLTITSSGSCVITVVNTSTAANLGTVTAGQSQSFTIDAGQIVQANATGTACSPFANWTVDAAAPTTANPISITMNAAHTAVAASTNLGPYLLGTASNPAAGGSVNSSVNGQPAGPSFPCGTIVTVTAVPADGYKFISWGGANAGDLSSTTTISATILMSSTKNITANFEALPPFVVPGAIMSIPLVAGWNTFSTPIALSTTEDTWGELLTVNGITSANIDIVYTYNSVTKVWVQVIDTDPVKTLDGYYIKMKTAKNIEIAPSTDASAPPVKTLTPGLNLVGFASLVDRSATTYLTSVYQTAGGGIGYTVVLNPPVNTPNNFDGNVFIRDGSPSPTLKVGKAYWVNMLNSGDLIGFTSTPLP